MIKRQIANLAKMHFYSWKADEKEKFLKFRSKSTFYLITFIEIDIKS